MTTDNKQRRNTVLVGVDGSPTSRQALAFAEKEARMRDAELVVLTSVMGLDPVWLRPYRGRSPPRRTWSTRRSRESAT